MSTNKEEPSDHHISVPTVVPLPGLLHDCKHNTRKVKIIRIFAGSIRRE